MAEDLRRIKGRSQLRPLVELAIWLTLVIGMWVYSYQFDRKLPSKYAETNVRVSPYQPHVIDDQP